MITEHALLTIRSGQEQAFETAFETARHIIAAATGFQSLSLARGVESPSTYLFLVSWDSVEDHQEGFRGSPAFDEWRALLHGFYAPMPIVEHFAEVSRMPAAG